jgi:hypothetical protein
LSQYSTRNSLIPEPVPTIPLETQVNENKTKKGERKERRGVEGERREGNGRRKRGVKGMRKRPEKDLESKMQR